MDSADLSAWLGKPPTTSKIQQSGEPPEDAGRVNDSGDEHSVAGELGPEDPSNSDIIQSQSEAEQQDEADYEVEETEEEEASFRSPSTILQNGFFIDLPEIHNKDEYESLPGHFTVRRVISEHPHDKYLVKLGSGEVELVCVSKYSLT